MTPNNTGILGLLASPIVLLLGGLILARYNAYLSRKRDRATTDQSSAAAALAKAQGDSATVSLWKDLLAATTDQNEELRRRNANLEIERVQQNTKLLDLEQAVSRNTQQSSAAQVEITQLRQQVADLSAQLEEARKEITRLLTKFTGQEPTGEHAC